ncbi:MAG: hypothetical protein WA139_01305 [Candidatus Aenigmatarchaeota archaeon]
MKKNEIIEARIKFLANIVEGGEKAIRERLLKEETTFFYIEKYPNGTGRIIDAGIQKYIGEKYHPNEKSYFTSI